MISTRVLVTMLVLSAPTVTVLAGARGRGPAQDAVELAEATWSEGDAVRSTYHSSSALHTVIQSEGKLLQEFDSIEEKSGSKLLTVLAADSRGPTRLRLEYGALKAVQQRVNGASGAQNTAQEVDEVDERNPLQNRAFTLVRQARSFRVLDENGTRVPEGLARLVLEEEGVHGDEYLRPGDRIALELVGKALPIGAEIPLSPEAVRAFLETRPGSGDVRFTVTPKGNRDEDGSSVIVFAARVAMARQGIGGEPDTAVDLNGEIRFDGSSGRFLSIQLDGILTLEAVSTDQSRAVEVTGQGPWSIRESARYERSR